MTIPPDQARCDLVALIKAIHARRPLDVQLIASRYGLQDYDAGAVSVGIEAASHGRDPLMAVVELTEGDRE